MIIKKKETLFKKVESFHIIPHHRRRTLKAIKDTHINAYKQ
jgi:hypothetical protein